MFIHNLNPVILDLGIVEIRWYGIIYALAFIIAYLWMRNLRAKSIMTTMITTSLFMILEKRADLGHRFEKPCL